MRWVKQGAGEDGEVVELDDGSGTFGKLRTASTWLQYGLYAVLLSLWDEDASQAYRSQETRLRN